MAMDVLAALCAVPSLARIMLVGGGADQARLAGIYGCDYVEDDPHLDISRNLARITGLPQFAGSTRLLYMPADLPQVTARDVIRILSRAGEGITICRATRDGGTNAMVASPATWMHFSLGSGSAERHAQAAEAGGRPVAILDDIAFQRDIDTPDDLAWLCRCGASGKTLEYLRRSRLDVAVIERSPESLASHGMLAT